MPRQQSATSTPVTVTVDNQAPTGTVVINGGAAATNNRTVTLLALRDRCVTSVTQMRFSNTGTSFSTAEAFAPTKTWTLSSGAGTKTVYVQFRDAAGNWSTAVTDTIVSTLRLRRSPGGPQRTSPAVRTDHVDHQRTGDLAGRIWAHQSVTTSTTPGDVAQRRADGAPQHHVQLPRPLHRRRRKRSGQRQSDRRPTRSPLNPHGPHRDDVRRRRSTSRGRSTDNVAVTAAPATKHVGTSTTTTFRPGPHTQVTPCRRSTRLNPSGHLPGPHDAHARRSRQYSTAHRSIVDRANASDNIGVGGVNVSLVDNVVIGGEDTTSPYSVSWDTTTVSNGIHTIVARARDTSNNTTDSLPVTVTVSNTQIAGLVAAYSFDEGTGTTANDSSGQGNTATLNNGVAWVTGQHGKAVSFDGVNDYITIPNSASTNISGNALTLSMWINPQPLASGDSVVIGKFWNTTQSSPYYQYGLELGGGNRTDFYVGTTSGPLAALGGTTLPFNQWSYLAITFDGAQVKTYVNGALVNTQALSATITARGNPMNIGADASPAQFNKGMLDDLRIYSRVLTQAQVQADMTTPVGGTIAGLTASLNRLPGQRCTGERHRECDCRRD